MRARSHWGWGWSDRFAAAEARQAIAAQLEGVLGIPAHPPVEPVPLTDVVISPSRVPAPAHLSFVTDDREARIRHTYGRSYPDLVRAFRGDFSPAPDLVASPSTEADVQATLTWASAHRVAVIPYGGGTSVVRGIEPDVGPAYTGTLSLDLECLNQVLEVDQTSLAARIQAGVRGPALEEQLAPHGLTLRHFPQSFEFSTLGGWIATRAGGHFATVHTHIDDFVEGLTVITPQGRVQTRRLPASGAGPSPDRLWMGSEGMLGVITEAWMRVQRRPRWRSTANATFTDWDAAVGAVRDLAQGNLHPANCRLLDKREAMLHGVRLDGTHVLILGFESADHDTTSAMEAALAVVSRHGGACPEGARHSDDGAATGRGGDAGAWRQAFFDGPYLQTSLVSLGVTVDTFETACTWDAFPALHEAVVRDVRDAIQQATGRRGFVSCRFTHVYPDGVAPYYTFVATGPQGEELQTWTTIKTAASEALLRHGGTITHHHAVGRLHQPWYTRQRPDLFADVLVSAKATLDPEGILNPGVLIPHDRIHRGGQGR